MPLTRAGASRRDSWPPTQVRLSPTIPDEYPSLDDIDEDPLTFFLTPTPDFEDTDMDGDMEMDFDAGIEDSGHPGEIVRSISPSSLDALNKAKGRKGSPQRDVPELSDTASPGIDTDDDEEEYIRFQPHGHGLPFSLRDFTIDGIKFKPRSATAAPKLEGGRTADSLLSPVPARGRPPLRPHARGRPRSISARRRPQHLWREPSPDVWSIEEETEEELMSDMGSSVAAHSDAGDYEHTKEELNEMEQDFPAAKPKKKVRFVLPVEE